MRVDVKNVGFNYYNEKWQFVVRHKTVHIKI